jgi:hypothetical protein
LKLLHYENNAWVDVTVSVNTINNTITGVVSSLSKFCVAWPTAKPAEEGKTWYLAEGSTAGGMETWVLVQNPGDNPVTVSLNLQTDQGEKTFPALTNQTIAPRSRVSYPIHSYIQTFNVSTLVTASGEVVCERAMYGPGKIWGTDSLGFSPK